MTDIRLFIDAFDSLYRLISHLYKKHTKDQSNVTKDGLKCDKETVSRFLAKHLAVVGRKLDRKGVCLFINNLSFP